MGESVGFDHIFLVLTLPLVTVKSMSISTTSKEGWFEDPAGLADLRYFDGRAWTKQTKALPSNANFSSAKKSLNAAANKTSGNAPEVNFARSEVPSFSNGVKSESSSQKPMASSIKPGWYPDPAGTDALRYHDGITWAKETKTREQLMQKSIDESESASKPFNAPNSTFAPTPRKSTPEAPVAPPVASFEAANSFSSVNSTNEAAVNETDVITDPRLAAAVNFAKANDELPDTTAIRLSRRSLGDLAHTEEVLALTPIEKSSKKISWIAGIVGVFLLGCALYANVFTNFLGKMGQDDLRAEYAITAAQTPTLPTPIAPVVEEEPVAEAPVEPEVPPFNREPMPTLLEAGAATGIIKIPSIGVDQVFVSGTQVPDLKKGPGIWEYGAFPGTPGNATISGHRTTYGGPFRHIDQLKIGDQIIVSVAGQPDAVFEVRGSLIVEPSRVQVTENTPGVRLTLTTCEPVGSDAERLVVQAELIEGAWVDHAVGPEGWEIMS